VDLRHHPFARPDCGYLYLIIDIYSRRIMCCEVQEEQKRRIGCADDPENRLEGRHRRQTQVLHADNSSPMKAATKNISGCLRSCDQRNVVPALGCANNKEVETKDVLSSLIAEILTFSWHFST
jgi:hypothetical protein